MITQCQKAFLKYGETELVLERAMEIILKKINDYDLIDDQDIAVILDKRLLILKTFQTDISTTTTSEWAEQLVSLLSLIENSPISCGLGTIVNSIPEYLASYKQAEYCLKNCTSDQSVRSIYDRDLLIRYMFFETKLHRY